jgi:hypothetical protein
MTPYLATFQNIVILLTPMRGRRQAALPLLDIIDLVSLELSLYDALSYWELILYTGTLRHDWSCTGKVLSPCQLLTVR